jgi:hypothetical protein
MFCEGENSAQNATHEYQFPFRCNLDSGVVTSWGRGLGFWGIKKASRVERLFFILSEFEFCAFLVKREAFEVYSY